MSFLKPDIRWTPRPIDGDTDIRPASQQRTASASKPVSETDRLRDVFSSDDQEVIDEYLEEFHAVSNELREIGEALDSRLSNMAVTYDIKALPLLNESHHCPFCGRENAGNVITMEDVRRHKDFLNKAQTAIFQSVIPSGFGNMSPQDVASQQEKMFSQLVAETLDQAWRQVLIWVLEVFLRLTEPLKNVPGASAVPNGIESLIDMLRGRKSSSHEQELRKEPFSDTNLNDYYKGVGGPSAMSSLGGVYRNCVRHCQEFGSQVDNLTRETKYGTYLKMQEANDIAQKNVASANQIAGVVIPGGYEYPDFSTNGLKYINPVPETYLQARADGKGVMPSVIVAGKEGLTEVIKSMRKEWVKNAKNVSGDSHHPLNARCCLIKNILSVGGIEGGRNFILAIRSLLALKRVLKSFDVRDTLVDLGNMIINLVNGVFLTIVQALAQLVKAEANRVLSLFDFGKNLKSKNSCLPWDELVDEASTTAAYFIKEVGSMLGDFTVNAKLINVKLGKTAKDSEEMLRLDRWIDLLDSAIKFSGAWMACKEGSDRVSIDGIPTGSVGDGSGGANPLISGEEMNTGTGQRAEAFGQNSVSGSTISNMGTVSAPGAFGVNGIPGSNNAGSVTWDTVAIKAFVTNYLHMDEKQAAQVMTTQGDCACDKILSDTELQIIRDALSSQETN